MKIYEVKARYVFDGIFRIKAESRKEARESIEKYCGLVMGGSIHTTLGDEDIDWNFGIHPATKIISVIQGGQNNQ